MDHLRLQPDSFSSIPLPRLSLILLLLLEGVLLLLLANALLLGDEGSVPEGEASISCEAMADRRQGVCAHTSMQLHRHCSSCTCEVRALLTCWLLALLPFCTA